MPPPGLSRPSRVSPAPSAALALLLRLFPYCAPSALCCTAGRGAVGALALARPPRHVPHAGRWTPRPPPTGPPRHAVLSDRRGIDPFSSELTASVALIVTMARVGGRGVVLVGLLGRFGAGECQNLPQRRSGPGSAARRSAEYQRFFSRVPARSGPLWQIWTIRRRRPAGEGVRGPGDGPGGRPGERTGPAGRGAGLLVQPRTPKNAETCTLHSKVQFQPSLSSAKCTSRRGGAGHGRRGPRRRPRPGTSPVIR